MSLPPRVLLVDDDAMVTTSLRRVLMQHCDLEVVTETSGIRALGLLNASRFDLLVADLRLPGLPGTALLELAARRWPNMRRALLTGQLTDEWPSVADAVFLKGDEPAEIVENICRLARFNRAVE